jgi:steroid C-25 hydroxylase gamma subunit
MTLQNRLILVAAEAAPGTDGLASATGSGWDGIPALTVDLNPTELDSQPSAYVRKAWENRPHGVTPSVRVQAALAGEAVLLRLSWQAAVARPAITDNNVFADACGVLFPLDGNKADIDTMGSEEWPVHAWNWRAGSPEPFVITARGLGTVERQLAHAVTADAVYLGDEWTVVFSRRLSASGVPLARGSAIPVGFAVWSGSNNERAGLKAYSPEWIELRIP